MNENFIQEYVNLIIEWGKAMEEANSKKSNKIHDKKNPFFNEIQKNLEIYKDSLLNLLNHKNNYVRSEVACLLLPYETEKAEAVLKEISMEYGSIACTARMTLRLWREGKLKY